MAASHWVTTDFCLVNERTLTLRRAEGDMTMYSGELLNSINTTDLGLSNHNANGASEPKRPQAATPYRPTAIETVTKGQLASRSVSLQLAGPTALAKQQCGRAAG